MILPSDKEYTQTKRIILGTDKMKSEFIPLAEWIDKTYDVKTINIIYDTLNNKTPRIQICFEYENEKNKFLTNDISYFDNTKQKAIRQKFGEIIKQQELSKSNNSILNIFGLNKKGIYLTENVFVVYGAFEPVAKIEATYKIKEKQTEEFIKSFDNKDIWTISIGFTIPTFFMFTDEKVRDYDKSEIKEMWIDKYYEFIKPFDEFNYFKRNEIKVLIDSKENFDNNYES
ncbi:hypothetical protein, partial [Flavobacterium sp. A45]|uniref:hypothetical protein n=1 Tax=Flavobacterium sp. A45 TaxID=1945862 RepID=UPI000986396D